MPAHPHYRAPAVMQIAGLACASVQIRHERLLLLLPALLQGRSRGTSMPRHIRHATWCQPQPRSHTGTRRSGLAGVKCGGSYGRKLSVIFLTVNVQTSKKKKWKVHSHMTMTIITPAHSHIACRAFWHLRQAFLHPAAHHVLCIVSSVNHPCAASAFQPLAPLKQAKPCASAVTRPEDKIRYPCRWA